MRLQLAGRAAALSGRRSAGSLPDEFGKIRRERAGPFAVVLDG